jgi:hypothetical protein
MHVHKRKIQLKAEFVNHLGKAKGNRMASQTKPRKVSGIHFSAVAF